MSCDDDDVGRVIVDKLRHASMTPVHGEATAVDEV